MLSEFELGDEALRYIRSELAHGRGLARHLLGLPLEQGRVVTYLPSTVVAEDLLDFGSGGVAGGEENVRLAELIVGYLRGRKTGIPVCVFEHYAHRGDPWKKDLRYFVVDEEVFLLVHRDTRTEEIAKTAQKAHLYPSIGILSTLPQDQSLPEDRSEQDLRLLQGLSERTDHVMIGAYDAEAWLVWSRRRT